MTIVLMNSLLFDGGGEFEGGLFRLVVEFSWKTIINETCDNIVLTIICTYVARHIDMHTLN